MLRAEARPVRSLKMRRQRLWAVALLPGVLAGTLASAWPASEARANDLVLHAVLISLGLSLCFTVLIGWGGATLFSWFGGQGNALQACLDYAHVAFAGSACLWLTNSLACC